MKSPLTNIPHHHAKHTPRSNNPNMAPTAIDNNIPTTTSTSTSRSAQPPDENRYVHDKADVSHLTALSYGNIVLPGIPTFDSMTEKRQWQLEHMVRPPSLTVSPSSRHVVSSSNIILLSTIHRPPHSDTGRANAT